MSGNPNSDPSFEEYWRRQFESFAAARDDDAGIAGWSQSGLEARMRHFTSRWRGEPGGLWLDAGCGAGTYCRFLAGQSLRVIGADYSLPSLRKAKQRNAASIRWVQADVNHLPVRPGRFDGAVCFGVMQAISEARPAIRELAEAVKPGGEVWVDALNTWSLIHVREWAQRRLTRRRTSVRYERPAHMRRVFEEAGLGDVRVDWVPIVPAGWRRIRRGLESPAARWLLANIPGVGALLSHAFVIRGRKL